MTKQSILAPSPAFWLWRANNRWQNELKTVLKQDNLTYSEFIVLAILVFDMNWRAMNQKQLACKAEVNEMIVSQTFRSLQDKKLVWRAQGIVDGRAYSIRATSSGFNLVKKVLPATQIIDKRILKQLAADPIFLVKVRTK